MQLVRGVLGIGGRDHGGIGGEIRVDKKGWWNKSWMWMSGEESNIS